MLELCHHEQVMHTASDTMVGQAGQARCKFACLQCSEVGEDLTLYVHLASQQPVQQLVDVTPVQSAAVGQDYFVFQYKTIALCPITMQIYASPQEQGRHADIIR